MFNTEKQVYSLIWQGIDLHISYRPDISFGGTEPEEVMAHVEVRAPKPLPITSTGYRSCFIHRYLVEQAGGAVPFVRQWLDEMAKKPAWKEFELQSRQTRLF